jgi:hypothetical protein
MLLLYKKFDKKGMKMSIIQDINKKGYAIILSDKSLQMQFSDFCERNKPSDMEVAIDYFAVFGGLEINLDLNKPITELIEKHILDDYKSLRNIISDFTGGDNLLHAILSGIAQGDRRTNSAFKRAKVSYDEGMDCIDELRQNGILSLESSYHHLCKANSYVTISDKLHFTSPFLRFWFAFVSPLFRGIKEGDYTEFFKEYTNKEAEFRALVFEQLCHAFVRKTFEDDRIYELGRYWDEKNEIDLVGKTRAGRVVAGVCKYNNAKIKKSELNKLKATCEEVGLHTDIYIIFSKRGFTSELKSMKSEGIRLFTCKSLKVLIEV